MRPIVALVTDFGTQDHYVGAVKGAILAAEPEAQLVDIVHELPAHDIVGRRLRPGGRLPARSRPGSVFLCVVDPGVGSARRGARPRGGRLLLRRARQRDLHARARRTSAGGGRTRSPTPACSVTRWRRPSTRATSSPRWRRGSRGACRSPRWVRGIADPIVFPVERPRLVGDGVWEAPVVHVDRFGNLITAFTALDVEAILAGVGGDPSEVVVVVEGVVMPLDAHLFRRGRGRSRARSSAARGDSRSPFTAAARAASWAPPEARRCRLRRA